jgi:hypothetical protein
MNPQKQSWPIVRSCLLVIVTALSIAACAGPVVQVSVPAQKTDKKTNKDMLQMCAVVSDQDMSEIRGGYGFYSFGLDFVGNLDFASKRIDGSVKAWAVSNKDLKTSQNFTNGQVDPAATGVSFEAGNSQVAFHSSVGKSSLGTGVVQLVQVMGNNNVVYATTNVTLNIKNFAPIKPTVSGIGGLNFMGR